MLRKIFDLIILIMDEHINPGRQLYTQNSVPDWADIRHDITWRLLYGVRNLEMTISFSLKSRPSEWFHRPEMSQIKAEISLRSNLKLNYHKNVGCQWYQWIPDFYNIRFWANLFNGKFFCGLKPYVIKIRESIDIIAILHFYENSTSCWYVGGSQL